MLNRRRFIAISAAVLAGTPAWGKPARHTFRALGAECSVTLPDIPADEAQRTVQKLGAEIARIEQAFSLWNPESELSRLNRDGRIDRPSRVFQIVSLRAMLLAEQTGGSFDPTVQPIWSAYAEGREPDFSLVGHAGMVVNRDAALFRRSGMAATFNGIAQGAATDAVIQLLKSLGYTGVLANIGEFRGLGERPGGGGWRIGVTRPGTDDVVAEVSLSDDAPAVATSEPCGTLISGHPHIQDPLQRPGPRWAGVTVQAVTASVADALSTAVAAAPQDEAGTLLEAGGATAALMIPEDGPPVRWTG